jgi:S-(hydroxymethyl)glutathione dehydrogenase/alcohol dehydrogenase
MSMTVRAAVARDKGRPLTIENVELRAPAAGEVLVQMKASGLCHTDLSALQGSYPQPFPIILGHEGAGIVLACGPGVSRVQPGDHVVLHNTPQCGVCAPCRADYTRYCIEMSKASMKGAAFTSSGHPLQTMSKAASFATHTVLSEFFLTPIPSQVPFESACLIGCGVMTGTGAALNTARVRPGSTVVVFGMGSIGLNAVQGARLAGAARIVAVDINPAKEAAARHFGATDFVNPATLDAPVEQHLPILLGGPADFSFECIGNTELLRQALAVVNLFWGVCIAVGIPPHGGQIELPATAFYVGRRLQGTLMGDGKPLQETRRLIDWYTQGELRLDELVTRRIALDEINEGFEMMQRGEVIRSVIIY